MSERSEEARADAFAARIQRTPVPNEMWGFCPQCMKWRRFYKLDIGRSLYCPTCNLSLYVPELEALNSAQREAESAG